jgi:CubicO group peptidase (beta-lactamase class C family)
VSLPAGTPLTSPASLGAGLVRDLERAVRGAQSQWHCPAVSAGVVRDGVLVWSCHVGSARLDPTVAPSDHTQYMIGSITKTFTAVLIMALRDAGRLVAGRSPRRVPPADQTWRYHHPADAGSCLRPAA